MASSDNQPKTVLAAVDYSPVSSLVVEHAIEQAIHTKADELHFVHVSRERDSASREARRVELASWLNAALEGPGRSLQRCRVIGHEATGSVSDVIVQLASDLLAHLVVVGTSGRGGFPRLLGSTAESVVRHCGCPVLVARRHDHADRLPHIEPPCPRCVAARLSSHGTEVWCEQHRERHGPRHTYYDPRATTWSHERLTP